VEDAVELGYLLYFLAVFVFGGILLLGLATYFGWEVATRKHRPPWSKRTRRAKAMIVLSALLFAWLLSIPLRMIWVTRVSAIPGSYNQQQQRQRDRYEEKNNNHLTPVTCS
jgi:hypothetical protein